MIGRFDRLLLKALLRQSCPDTIPRSGEKGKRVRCYSIYLKAGDGDLWLKSIDETGLTVSRWNGSQFEKPHAIPFSDTQGMQVKIERYIGLLEFSYSNVWQCVVSDWTYANRLPIILEALSQFFFSRKDLGLTERVKTLQALVQKSIEDSNFGVTEVNLPSLLHGRRWILHPDRERQQTYARLLLDSFAESGELEKDKDNVVYRITGKALTTLSQYETEKQRHEQILSQSLHMKWLTFALFLVGVVSAGVTYLVSNGTQT